MYLPIDFVASLEGLERSQPRQPKEFTTSSGMLVRRVCAQCHQRILTNFANRYGPLHDQVHAALLEEENAAGQSDLVTKNRTGILKFFAQDGKIAQSEYAADANGKETFADTHAVSGSSVRKPMVRGES